VKEWRYVATTGIICKVLLRIVPGQRVKCVLPKSLSYQKIMIYLKTS